MSTRAVIGWLQGRGAVSLGAAGLVLSATVAGPAAAAGAVAFAERPTLLFRLHDPRLTEVSGAAVGIRSPDALYVHNDSGDRARFFALDARTGEVRAQFTVPGAVNVDWEDIAVARDARGVPSIWIADIGDNDATRSSVRIYRVDEPRVTEQTHGLRAVATHAQTWRLRYPGGPRNAEGIVVFPGGATYLFDKTLFGPTTVYAVPPRPSASVQTVTTIGSFSTRDTGTLGGPNPFGRLTVTGASTDGTVLAVRTYTDAYLWRVTAGTGTAGLRQALLVKPRVLALPTQPQGEGIAVHDGRLIVTSEKTGSGVYSLPQPVLPPAPTAHSTVPTASSSVPAASASPGQPAGAATTRQDGVSALPTSRSSRSSTVARQTLAALAAALTVGLASVVGIRLIQRRRNRPDVR